ncbi:glycine-rich protein [Rhynchospora pubera]|uniref:Glycine-rich protein n=1 Tax=Rhynchospora pubera TaxID=906938 RepID=A0AAV8FQ92_9POAL|nr:glycine-rich protein [Rhynchospora pubera]
MAGIPDDFNEDDFVDFNPHPYLGGYDITKTYGAPLPPSAAICYPLSLPASSPPVVASTGEVNLSEDTVPVKEPKEEPEPVTAPAPVVEPDSEKAISTPVVDTESEKPIVTPVVEQPWFEPYQYGEAYQAVPYKPDIFRSWPFSIPQHCCPRKEQVRDFDYWNHMMRGLDFLFGHAQGYGERRAGIDVYGTPIYANKRSATESVTVHVEQPCVQTLEYHESSAVQVYPDGLDTWPSGYGKRNDEKYDAYGNNHYGDNYYDYEQRTSNWDHDHNYSDAYHDWTHNNWGYSSNVEGESGEENNLFSTPIYSYNKHHHEQPLHVQVEPTDQTWTQKMISYEGYSSNVEGESGEENNLFSTPIYSYNKHHHEQPLHVQVEPTDQTWTQKMISYESNNSSYYESGEEVHHPINLSNGYERESYEHTQYEPLEPFKPSWSQNLGFYGEYLEGEAVRSEDYPTFHGGGHNNMSFAYNEENNYYEQNQSSSSTGDSYVLHGEDVSNKPNWDDEPRNWTDAIFGSSPNYYAYDK